MEIDSTKGWLYNDFMPMTGAEASTAWRKRMAFTHIPVLFDEVMTYMPQIPQGVYLDGTLGGGGHSEGILSRCPEASLYGIDRDPNALSAASERLKDYPGFHPVGEIFMMRKHCWRRRGSHKSMAHCWTLAFHPLSWTRENGDSPIMWMRRWTCAWTHPRGSRQRNW